MNKKDRKQRKIKKRHEENKKKILNRRMKMREEAKVEKILNKIRKDSEPKIGPIINEAKRKLPD
jgi:hypothetical protein